MTNDRSASSSDLQLARDLSRGLRGPKPAPAGTAAEPGYIRFSPERFAPPRSGPTREATPAEAPDEILRSTEVFGPGTWERFLDWAMKATSGRTVFVFDGRGMLVAHRGPTSPEEVHRVGGHLAIAIEQAALIEPERSLAPAVAIEVEEGWLTGLWITTHAQETLTVGMLAPVALSGRVRAAVGRALGAVTP